jgi:integrase
VPVARRTIKGAKYWVIDRRFRGPTGEERFRRAAQVQTKPAAEAEERRVIDYWTEHGTIKPLLTVVKVEPEPQPKGKTWDDAVDHFREITLPKKKPSTRRGYEALLNGPGIKRWSGAALNEIDREAINVWDTDLIKAGMADSTRRNQHIILRAVLKSVGPKGCKWLVPLPEYPTLPKVGEAALVTVSVEDLHLLLNEGRAKYCQAKAVQAAQLAMAVAAYAGMRAGKVRALRRRDVDLERGIITVRVARTAGEESTPKSKHARTIPIAAPLLERLRVRCEGLRPDDHVCVMANGKTWGDQGILAAMKRACVRLKIEGSRYHGLRHFFGVTFGPRRGRHPDPSGASRARKYPNHGPLHPP